MPRSVAGYDRARMTAAFNLTVQDKYVHVLLAEGYEITPEGRSKALQAISEACKQHRLRKVLIEGEVAGRRMSTTDAFATGALAASLMSGTWLALCYYGYKPDSTSELFQISAENRGVRVQFFDEREAALRWLGVA
jgi:hypothetical protein